jgi:hypothetical protein
MLALGTPGHVEANRAMDFEIFSKVLLKSKEKQRRLS